MIIDLFIFKQFVVPKPIFLLTSWKTKLKYIDPQYSWIKSYCLNSEGLLQTSYFDSVYYFFSEGILRSTW